MRQQAISAQAQAVIQTNLKWWNPKTYVFNFVRNMAEALHLPDRVMYQQGDIPIQSNNMNLNRTHSKVNQGIAVSKGVVTALAAIIIDPEPQCSVHGKILVSKMTDPGWVFLMMQAAGLVSEKGSLLSHTAIVGRKLGIPVVVGLKDATSIFKNGDLLKLDGSLGTVEAL